MFPYTYVSSVLPVVIYLSLLLMVTFPISFENYFFNVDDNLIHLPFFPSGISCDWPTPEFHPIMMVNIFTRDYVDHHIYTK